jgi:hypothetical protein
MLSLILYEINLKSVTLVNFDAQTKMYFLIDFKIKLKIFIYKSSISKVL